MSNFYWPKPDTTEYLQVHLSNGVYALTNWVPIELAVEGKKLQFTNNPDRGVFTVTKVYDLVRTGEQLQTQRNGRSYFTDEIKARRR